MAGDDALRIRPFSFFSKISFFFLFGYYAIINGQTVIPTIANFTTEHIKPFSSCSPGFFFLFFYFFLASFALFRFSKKITIRVYVLIYIYEQSQSRKQKQGKIHSLPIEKDREPHHDSPLLTGLSSLPLKEAFIYHLLHLLSLFHPLLGFTECRINDIHNVLYHVK